MDNNAIEHNGYAIRRIKGSYIIAIPMEAKCFVHKIDRFESTDTAMEIMKQVIDQDNNG